MGEGPTVISIELLLTVPLPTGRRGVIFDRNGGLIFIAQIDLVDSKQ